MKTRQQSGSKAAPKNNKQLQRLINGEFTQYTQSSSDENSVHSHSGESRKGKKNPPKHSGKKTTTKTPTKNTTAKKTVTPSTEPSKQSIYNICSLQEKDIESALNENKCLREELHSLQGTYNKLDVQHAKVLADNKLLKAIEKANVKAVKMEEAQKYNELKSKLSLALESKKGLAATIAQLKREVSEKTRKCNLYDALIAKQQVHTQNLENHREKVQER